MSAPLRVGIVGFGYSGPELVRNFTACEHTEVRAIADTDERRRAAVKQMSPWVDAAESYETLLSDADIDAIVIATPMFDRHTVAKAALLAGKHVLVESPMAETGAECTELITLAKDRGLTLMVDHPFVYTGAVKRTRELLDDGRLGRVLAFDAVRRGLGLFPMEFNVLWDLAVHDLAIADYLIDAEAEWISVSGAAHFGEDPDMAHVTIGYADELLAHIQCAWAAPIKTRRVSVTGFDRLLVYDDLLPAEHVKIFESGVDIEQLDPEVRHHLNGQQRTGDIIVPKLDTTAALTRMATELARACRDKIEPLSGGVAGLRVVQLLEAAQESLENDGDRIEL